MPENEVRGSPGALRERSRGALEAFDSRLPGDVTELGVTGVGRN